MTDSNYPQQERAYEGGACDWLMLPCDHLTASLLVVCWARQHSSACCLFFAVVLLLRGPFTMEAELVPALLGPDMHSAPQWFSKKPSIITRLFKRCKRRAYYYKALPERMVRIREIELQKLGQMVMYGGIREEGKKKKKKEQETRGKNDDEDDAIFVCVFSLLTTLLVCLRADNINSNDGPTH
ncbi:hypothetical protein B0J12DRAFT_17389 [Macrophomina phaseolina]|uniref:Uncharacterized protein n=1 Tax=Macrophomina phaseolina TaxID=35725 RepID=A0ABQ8GUH0_9PEZI|nr:hypothetical protein B0J12DRAFT_17389 [Macrophomina phaseolina]